MRPPRHSQPHAPTLLLPALPLLPAVSAGDAQSHQWAAGREVREATAPSLRPLPPALAGSPRCRPGRIVPLAPVHLADNKCGPSGIAEAIEKHGDGIA